jgi:hypothetical protein
MPTKELLLTTYLVKSYKPNRRFGSPAALPVLNNASRVYARVPIDQIPADANITSAIVRFYSDRPPGGSRILRAVDLLGPWKSSITWNTQPTAGTVLATQTLTNPNSWDLDVTAWAVTRSRNGLRIDSTSGTRWFLRGSSGARLKPKLIVTYTLGPLTPGDLKPDGGSVSNARPTLTYAGDDDMAEQKIEFSTDEGATISAATAWLPATTGRFTNADSPGTQPLLVSGGTGIWWRVTTRGPEGTSAPSAWAYYEYDALATPTLTAPPLPTITNLITNPSAETNTTGWTNVGTGATVTRDTTQFDTGVASFKVTTPGTVAAEGMQLSGSDLAVVGGSTYSARVRFKAPSGRSVRLRFIETVGAGGFNDTTVTATGNWQTVTITRTAAAAATAMDIRTTWGAATPIADTMYVDSVIVTKTDAPVSAYFDGDTPDDGDYFYDWTGTPHASTSVQTARVAVTDDGSPTLQWTVTTQTSYKAQLINSDTGEIVDSTEGFVADAAARAWTPGKGVRLPNGKGKFELWIRDGITPRVAASNAPIEAYATISFTTTLTGAGAAVDTISLAFEDPVPVISGTRALGIPDEIMLLRDGVAVPLWDEINDDYYDNWAPGSAFFTGNTYRLPDYTADLRHEHTWRIRVKSGGTLSAQSAAVTDKFATPSVWLLNPRTGDKVEIQGYDGVPDVEQLIEEASILHVPLNGGPIVEPKRRRLVRTTRSGGITGAVLDEHEALLEDWATGDSADRYRLIFGKVNWSVIIGDYNPVEVFYPGKCGPDRVLVELKWWQRKDNF